VPPLEVVLIVILIVFLTRFLESALGFGGTVVALPVLIILTPTLNIHTLVPVLALGSIVGSAGIVALGYKDIVKAEYFRILSWAAIGLPVGFVTSAHAPEDVLRAILGTFIVIVAVANVFKRQNAPNDQQETESLLVRIYLHMTLIAGGIIHGIFATGGPLLVIYGARALRTKGLFRVTLVLVWLSLNIILATGWILNKQIPSAAWPLVAVTIPFIIVAIIVGNVCHHRLPEATFRKAVYFVLLVVGVLLLSKSLPQIIGNLTDIP